MLYMLLLPAYPENGQQFQNLHIFKMLLHISQDPISSILSILQGWEIHIKEAQVRSLRVKSHAGIEITCLRVGIGVAIETKASSNSPD